MRLYLSNMSLFNRVSFGDKSDVLVFNFLRPLWTVHICIHFQILSIICSWYCLISFRSSADRCFSVCLHLLSKQGSVKFRPLLENDRFLTTERPNPSQHSRSSNLFVSSSRLELTSGFILWKHVHPNFVQLVFPTNVKASSQSWFGFLLSSTQT